LGADAGETETKTQLESYSALRQRIKVVAV
jgi:hypothetical protein